MKDILVLCVGNICRSPMAAALLQRDLPERRVRSAGLAALVNHPADPFSIHIMSDRNIDISMHRSQQVNSVLISEADLVLVMEKEQKREVEKYFIGAKGKVFVLNETDVPDPYRKTLPDFRFSAELIDLGVRQWVKKIRSLDN